MMTVVMPIEVMIVVICVHGMHIVVITCLRGRNDAQCEHDGERKSKFHFSISICLATLERAPLPRKTDLILENVEAKGLDQNIDANHSP